MSGRGKNFIYSLEVSCVLQTTKVLHILLILPVPTPVVEGQVFKALGIAPAFCNPYPLLKNTLAVTKLTFKLESYDPVTEILALVPGTFPKEATFAVVIEPLLLAHTEKTSKLLLNVYPEPDNWTLGTLAVVIRLADDDILLIYRSNGPVFGEAPFKSVTSNVDPEGNDIILDYFIINIYLIVFLLNTILTTIC